MPRDGIPALDNPEFDPADSPAADYLLDSHRVMGLFVEGEPWAVPHNIGWWHEIANLDFPGGDATCRDVLPTYRIEPGVRPSGDGWMDATAIHHDTEETFEFDGTRRNIFADGRAIMRSIYLTADGGLYEGLDFWLHLPFHRRSQPAVWPADRALVQVVGSDRRVGRLDEATDRIPLAPDLRD